MTKHKHLLILVGVVAILFLIAIGWVTFTLLNAFQPEDPYGPGGTPFGKGVTQDDPIIYTAAIHGTTCPLNTYFKGSRRSPEIGCSCPSGYEMDSKIIGGEAGDACYGPGTKCPILSSICAKKK